MALLSIIVAPDPRLKIKALPIDRIDAEIVRLMDDMLETMYAAPGIGLAAPQIGVAKRLIVIDASPEGNDPLQMANPEIIQASEERFIYEEGCLSLPDIYEEVARPARIQVRYRDKHSQLQTLEAENLLAVCIQHELDHLDGTLFVDHITALKRNIFLRKLAKGKKTGAIKGEYVPAPAKPQTGKRLGAL